uniref:Cytochrome b n=1 Tax=Berthellina sp. TLT-2006 TaxID=407122 RepID=E6Y136_9GAST|nr:cytochrome b [Berthellina sp. TLT-2006]ABK92222.1 cytochrome b [Berthellina sp. TLT-2006]
MQKMRQTNPAELALGLPSPSSLAIWWNGGSILGLLLVLQILTGLFLSMHYTADMINSFSSVIHIIRDAPMGWLFRNFHANGASLFFVFLYLHIGRGLYYQSYINHPHTWMVGVSIFLVSMGTAFLGYVLPWGQMSFWGATVITNLVSAVPYWGPSMVEWIWGGFSVSQPTLNRFYSLHFIMPFLIAGLSLLHLVFLHEKGSSNPLGNLNHLAKIPFHPYFTWKDSVGFVLVFIVLSLLCFFYPTLLGDPENYNHASSMVTPVHIQPEWYFLFAYAILRSIPSKLGGVVALLMSIVILYFLPLAGTKKTMASSFIPFYQVTFWGLVVTFVVLTWLGACPIEEPYATLAVPISIMYFMFYVVLIGFPSVWSYLLTSEYKELSEMST